MFDPHIPQDILALQALQSYVDYAVNTFNSVKAFFGGFFRTIETVEPRKMIQQETNSIATPSVSTQSDLKEKSVAAVQQETVPQGKKEKPTFGYTKGAVYTPTVKGSKPSKLKQPNKTQISPASSRNSLAESKKTSTSTESLVSVASSTTSKRSRRPSVDSGISISSTSSHKNKGKSDIAFGTKVPTSDQRIIYGKNRPTAEVTQDYNFRAKAIKK